MSDGSQCEDVLSTHDHLSWNLWVGGGVDQTERGLTSSLTPLCSLAALNTVVIETLAASIMAPRLAHYTQRRNCQHYTSLHYLPKTRIGAETRGGRVAGGTSRRCIPSSECSGGETFFLPETMKRESARAMVDHSCLVSLV